MTPQQQRWAPLPRARAVATFDALVATPLRGGVNALYWPRTLDGDFGALARALAPTAGLAIVDVDALAALPLGPGARAAAAAIVDDVARLHALGLDPVVNCIVDYPRDDRGLPIATDVLSLHVDRAPVAVDTWLCTYHGKPTEALDNDHARRRTDDPAVVAALRAVWRQERGAHGRADRDVEDDDGFAAFVRKGSFDLHYEPVDGAAPCAFGVGELWRLATQWPGALVPPCIHRAPRTGPGDEPRLLLLC
ncbi:MAG: hypothetical protein FJ137_10335 [Deltaproteobacteria bacterium]|nr:hypothetical protein [Deltaproteobacteria bacterium]